MPKSKSKARSIDLSGVTASDNWSSRADPLRYSDRR